MIRINNETGRRLFDWLAIQDQQLRDHAMLCHEYVKAFGLKRDWPLRDYWLARAEDAHSSAQATRDLAASIRAAIEKTDAHPDQMSVPVAMPRVDVGPLHRKRNDPAGRGMVPPTTPATALPAHTERMPATNQACAIAALGAHELAALVQLYRTQHLDDRAPHQFEETGHARQHPSLPRQLAAKRRNPRVAGHRRARST